MGYLQALNLLIRTYKATKGYLPKGIDMLKLKMKARQKVTDANKVIKVNFDKGNNWMKAKPQSTKGKVAETEAQMLARMKKQNKESVARLKEKKEKTLGEKLKDYKGDPDAMKDGGKVKKKRKHNDNIDEEDIGEGKSKERFLRVMPEVEDIPRSDGIMELATGGMTNIGDTYDNNPTLQSQYPNKQDYLDLFAQQTTTPTNSTTTTTNVVNQAATPILPPRVNPLIIPQGGDSGSGGGITNIARTNMNQPNAMGGKTPGFKAGAQRAFNDIKTVAGGLIDIAKYVNPLDPDKFNIMNLYKKGKEVFSKRSDKIVADQIAKAIALEEEMARREEDRIRSQSPTGSMNYGPSGYEGMSDAASDQEKSEGGRGSRG